MEIFEKSICMIWGFFEKSLDASAAPKTIFGGPRCCQNNILSANYLLPSSLIFFKSIL
jgi:hypothetical protein